MTTSIFPADKTQPFVADNGVTYVWEADRWRVKQYKLDDSKLEDYASKQDLATATAVLPYRIETDKTMREGVNKREVKSEGGEIQLVDEQGSFSNVTFTGRGGTLTGSTPAGITIDTTTLSTLISNNQKGIAELNEKYDNISFPEDSEPGYLPLSGGTLTNSLTFNRNKASIQFAIEPNSGTPDTNIYSVSGGQLRLRSTHTDSINDRVGSHIVLDPNGGTPETKIYNVIYPTDGSMAANRQYVDETAASPARLQWQYNGIVDNSSDPGSGNMVWHPGGTNNIIGYMRFSFITRDGLTNLGDGKFNDTTVSMDNGPIGTVWQWRFDIKKWKLILQFRVGQFRWNYNNHFEMGLTSQNGRRLEDIANVPYFVTVGGFF